MELTAPEPVPDPFGICRILGYSRNPSGFVAGGGFQRLGVRPDGSAVVFEVNNDVALSPTGLPSPVPQQGFFFAPADGSGRRWLAPASAAPIFALAPFRNSPVGYTVDEFPNLPFSPDGGQVVFTDMGPGPAGEMAIQIFTLDVATGGRRQVTHLPKAVSPIPGLPATGFPSFLTGDTVGFYRFANPDHMNPQGQLTAFTVRIDGTGLRALPSPVVGANGQVVPRFAIAGSGGGIATLVLPLVPPVNAFLGATGFFGSLTNEVFFVNGRRLLQLTDFRRVDTFGLFLDARRQRGFFAASANPPHGHNPTENCQLFSIDPLGAHLRQLTHFREGDHSSANGCDSGPPPDGCSVSLSTLARENPATGTIVFDSSCDPFGTNPSGVQLFAVQADGSRLRTLTHTRGYVVAPDGSFTTELVGNWDYAPSVR
jgi:hypothetical protein